MKNKFIIWISITGIICSILWAGLSFYTIFKPAKADKSIVLIENSQLSSYGTGFVSGEGNVVVTAYTTVATVNGASPKQAIIKNRGLKNDITAKVLLADADRNIAILKTDSPLKGAEPLILTDEYGEKDTIQVCGFDGNGTILSDYDGFNSMNIIKYSGNIINESDQYIKKLVYSAEFNRALVGGPAYNGRGEVVGMCAYGIRTAGNELSQYIIPASDILDCFETAGIRSESAEEKKIRALVMLTAAAGICVIFIIVLFAAIAMKRISEIESKAENGAIYIKITNGNLKGACEEIKDKVPIGRDPKKSRIVYPVDEPGISALHCTVYKNNGYVYIVDNGSKYGTYFMNGEKMKDNVPYRIDVNAGFYLADRRNSAKIINTKEL